MPDKYYLYLRPVDEQDLELIHSWRINPEIYSLYGDNEEPCSWMDTLRWWRNQGDTMMFIVMYIDITLPDAYWRGRPIGVTWARNFKDVPDIGGFIGEIDLLPTPITGKVYALTAESIKRMRNKSKVKSRVKWENKNLLSALGELGWTVSKDLGDNMLELSYGV
jgi:hypothetical protein